MALAPVHGATRSSCPSRQDPPSHAHVLRHYQNQPRPRLVAVGTKRRVDVLRSYVAAGKFRLHDFVVMPNHLHVLLTVGEGMTMERAMQLIKGGFSYRLKREYGYLGEVWQRGFSETRAPDPESFSRYRNTSRRTR